MTPENSGIEKKNKEVCVLIRVKPKYTEEFCIMMLACKELCKRVSKFKKLAKIDEAYSILGPVDFLLELSEKKYLCSWNEISLEVSKLKEFLIEDVGVSLVGDVKFEKNSGCNDSGENDEKTIDAHDYNQNKINLKMKDDKVTLFINEEKKGEFVKKDDDRIDIYRKEKEVDERINRTIFKIRETLGSYIYDTHTLTKYNTKNILENKKDTNKIDANKIDANKITKHVHVLIKIKPKYTKQFSTIFEGFCNKYTHKDFAMIKLCSIIGPFDFVFELITEGVKGEEEEMTEKINRTIFEIRETLGSYIYETHTIEKFRIPMTKEDLESFFKKKIGEENLVRLPHCEGEKVPHERYEPNDKIDLKEIYAAETTALKKLLENAKTFLEPENLDERIIDLNSRVEELEKRQGLRQR